jgi:hypothetical protein
MDKKEMMTILAAAMLSNPNLIKNDNEVLIKADQLADEIIERSRPDRPQPKNPIVIVDSTHVKNTDERTLRAKMDGTPT